VSHVTQAFCALDEAIKLSRSNWRLWQNYLYAALSSDHLTAAVDAAENLLELQVPHCPGPGAGCCGVCF